MSRQLPNRGYFGIGIEHTKSEENIGGLFRSAMVYGASFAFTIGRRYTRQSSDTPNALKHIPLYHYLTFDDFFRHLPRDCPLVGVEIDPAAIMLDDFSHSERACYLLGAEDHGLTKRALSACHALVRLPGNFCLNVATAGSIVMYDRWVKQEKKFSHPFSMNGSGQKGDCGAFQH